MTMRTRFAPSPTGYLHIGGVRTALFNWLLTQRHGGEFVLRIDDTDAQRNRTEALQPILDGFRWLGINWNEGPEVGGPYAPYFQSQRDHLYTAAAQQLLAAGHAYPCYRTKEELDAERKQAEIAKKPYVHRGEHRDTTPERCVELYRQKAAALRLKVPVGTSVVLQDLIRGKVEWQTDLLGDPVILRPDGRALYNFATVVDDAAMNITHVVRAAEHLSNTPIQLLVYQGLGAALPQFAHVPVVNEPKSKKKLSKRDMKKFVTAEVRLKLNAIGWTDEQIEGRDDLNPATVAFYRELGYLPAALINYLGRLGWSLDDKSEIINLEEMVAHFGLERVNESPASFDPDKLYWLAGEYMKALPITDRVAGVIPYLQRAGLLGPEINEASRAKLTRVVEACGDRLKLFSDILLYGSPFFRQDPLYEPQAVQKRLKKAGAAELLAQFRGELAAAEPFEVAVLEDKLRVFCENRKIGAGSLIHPLRVGTTGTEVGPGLFDCLAILGKEETLRRIDLALKLAESSQEGTANAK
jgi:nondiscriminating glutamyl-tRNA synthetase